MEEPIHISHFGLVITERCTLACKLCAEYSPYYSNPAHASLETIKKVIDCVVKSVDTFTDFSFFGGEPFVHQDLCDCIRYLGKYLEKIKRVLVLTNGTVLPKDDEYRKLIEDIPEYKEKLQFNISDYGPNLSKHVTELVDFCDKHNIKSRVIKYYGNDLFCDGWIDYGDHSKKYFTLDEVREHAQKCHFRNVGSVVTHITDNEFYMSRCTRSYRRKELGITPPDTTDVLCFSTEFKESDLTENRRMIRALLAAEYSDSCAYCNGMCDDSPRFTPAEQLTKEELQKIKKQGFGGHIL